MSLVKFVKGDTTSNSSTYTRQGTGNIEFDSTTKKIYLDGMDYTGEVEDELLENSNNPVSSSALYEVITQNELTTAAALTEHEDAISDINTALNNKQDALTFDTTPTTSSTNPVTSGGIKTYVDNNSPLKVTITYNQVAGAEAYLSDKKYSVIKTAITNGRVVKLYYNNKEFDLKAIDSTEVTFERNENDNTYTSIKITNVNHVQVTTGTTLVSGTNIKTVNSNSLLGSGDISLDADNLSMTTADPNGNWDANDSIEDAVIANSNAINDLDSNKQDTLVSGTNIKTINRNSLLGSGNVQLDGSNLIYTGSESYNLQASDTIDQSLDTLDEITYNKQDRLVSGTNIKTINDQSLLGSGNLDLNPLIFITFWTIDRPVSPSNSQYWYNPAQNEL